MLGVSLILQIVLAAVLVCLATASLQLGTLGFIRLFFPARVVRRNLIADANLPRVLVQLPVCDEGALALRVAAAAARLDWPADRLEIQVLDDGPAEKHAALASAIRELTPEGVNLKVLRRGVREGYKAGNLAFGLSCSDAPYVAVFDADFVPPADFLRRTVPAMVEDQGLAYVQARWGHANRNRNWLTRAQAFLLDSHFAVEQEARFRAGLPFSFNGTAGVWSRRAIDDGGGWTGDTLTEDLDLSIRCALKGWRGVVMRDIEVPSELPDTAAAWRAQQARWTKGHAQCAKKLLPVLWRSDFPAWKKAVVTLQICQFAFYTLAGISAVISLTLMALGVEYLPSVAMLGMVVTILGLCASLSYLACGQAMLGRAQGGHFLPTLLLAIVFPSGLILSNARATYEAFCGADLVFHRTQRNGETYKGGWRGRPELAAGLMLPLFAFVEQAWSAPFFVFAAAGLVSIGTMGLRGAMRIPAEAPSAITTAAE
ncbi:MAG TPA: glycosyltransferase family 2 protein [Rhizomicrobium sp.]|jgi:cellulose synthase/poly-beta-1,6-N-acetylglucosamine synthase-like glycosyltransferase